MLSKAEWDFRSLPDDQVEDCWTYEFARECPKLVSLIKDWRHSVLRTQATPKADGAAERLGLHSADDPDFNAFKRHAGGSKTAFIRIGNALRMIPLGAYFMFPEWPEMPYQDIAAGLRRVRLQALLEKETSRGLSQTAQSRASERAWKSRDGRVPNLREIEAHPVELGMITRGNVICMPALVFDKSSILLEGTDQIVIFRIPWDLADDRIVGLVSKWLEANRPRPDIKLGSVGGSEPRRKRRKDLERLGKVRIVRFFHNDYNRAWPGKKKLFADQSQWIKCRKAVERRIQEFESSCPPLEEPPPFVR
jgi:hypothetical protein